MKTQNQFPHLKLHTGNVLERELSGLLVEDEDGITALMIQNIDTHSTQFGNCILVDKDGTTNYYIPQGASTIEKAPLLECFKQITSDPEQALLYFQPQINSQLQSTHS